MNDENLYRGRRLKERLGDFTTLAVFTVIVAALSVVVMDLLVYPMVIFAMRSTGAFTFLVKYLFFGFFAGSAILFILLKIRRLKKGGLANREIGRYLVSRPAYYLSSFFIILLSSVVVLTIIYLLLERNYYLLYKLSGG